MPSLVICIHGQLRILGDACNEEECGPKFIEELDRAFLKSAGVKCDEGFLQTQ